MTSKALFLCFIDLKAAYDWINRDMLFKIFEIRLQSPILVKILKALYTGPSAEIKGCKRRNKIETISYFNWRRRIKKNVRAFKYLGQMIINTDDNQFNFLNFRISSAYQ